MKKLPLFYRKVNRIKLIVGIYKQDIVKKQTTVKKYLQEATNLEPSEIDFNFGVLVNNKKVGLDYIIQADDKVIVIPVFRGGAIEQWTEVSTQDIMNAIGEVFLDKLIQKIPKNSLRQFLFEKDIISKSGMARASKSQIINKLADNNLLKDAMYLIVPGHYSWFKEVARIINKNGYYDFTTEAARSFVQKGVKLDQKSIDILIDFLIELDDPDITFNDRKRILDLIEVYCRLNGFFYQDLQYKPFFVLFNEIRKILSKQENKFLSFSEVGDKIFGYRIYHKEILEENYGFIRIREIKEKCDIIIQDKDDLRYINGLIEAVAFYIGHASTNKDGFFKYFVSKTHLKDIEIDLINKIRIKLSSLNLWKSDFPTLSELENYFGIRLHSITSESENRQFTRVFTEEEIISIIEKLKKDLAPVDFKGYQELLVDLGNYKPDARISEIITSYGTFDNWLEEKSKILHGNTESLHPSDWISIRNGIEGDSALYLQSYAKYEKREDGSMYRSLYMFDAFTGDLIRANDYTIYTTKTGRKVKRSNWELHHINFDKTDNNPDNFLWCYKPINPITGESSHQTIFNNDIEKRKYIANGMMIKLALKYDFAPRIWSYENQMRFKELRRSQSRRGLVV